ncbi:MAG: FKBP-type peptidyl-prolyl cis-trans isomerase [Lachnospiraceae bacterium]|nr:FKBP-type peptidyl-prolyl cis-trans isomerase [Lachnospiraceae bacterium]
MKKKLTVLSAVLCASLALSACSSGDSSGGASSAQAEETAGDEAATAITSSEDILNAIEASGEGEEDFPGLLFPEDEAYLVGIDVSEYVSIDDYRTIDVVLPAHEITEEEIESQMRQMASYYLEPVEITDRDVSETGDTVIVDYSGRIKETGEVFQGGTTTDAQVEIGGSGYIEGFAEGMAGQKVGEEFEFEVTFPDYYPNNTDLENTPVIFTCTIHKITRVPELSDDNVAELQIENVTNMEELHDYTENYIEEQYLYTERTEIEAQVPAIIVERAEFADELPVRAMELHRFLVRRNLEQQASYYQMYGYTDVTVESMLEQSMAAEGFQGTADDFMEEIALRQLKQVMLFQLIAEKEGNLLPGEDTVDSEVEQMLSQYGQTEEEFGEQNGFRIRPLMYQDIIVNNVMEFLTERASVVYE